MLCRALALFLLTFSLAQAQPRADWASAQAPQAPAWLSAPVARQATARWRALTDSLKADSLRPALWAARAAAAQQLADTATALADLARALRLAPTDAALRLQRAQVLYALGQDSAALADIMAATAESAAATPPARAWLLKGMLHARLGAASEAEGAWAGALTEDPTLASRLFMSIATELATRRLASAQLRAEFLAAREPNRAIYQAMLARVHTERGALDSAATAYTRALAAAPTDAALLLRRAQVLHRLGRAEAALADATAALAADDALAEAYALRGDLRAAREGASAGCADWSAAARLGHVAAAARRQAAGCRR